MRIKVLLVFGTRPEAVKMCPLVLKMRQQKEIECVVCLTGQHKEMLEQVMDIFGIQAQYNPEYYASAAAVNDDLRKNVA